MNDWLCNCGEKNFNYRVNCRKCNLPKKNTNFNQIINKPGDWICECGVNNFKSRNVCFKCNKSKPGFINHQSNNNWICDNCAKDNFESRTICRACDYPRKHSVFIKPIKDTQLKVVESLKAIKEKKLTANS